MPKGQHDLLSTREIQGMFYEELRLDDGRSWLPAVATDPIPSDQASETYPWLGMVPPLEKRYGANRYSDLGEQKITIENDEYQTGVRVDRMFLRRDKTAQLRIRLGDLASRANAHWKGLIRTLIRNGTGATSGLCYDGSYFFADDHSEGSAGTQKNLLTSGEVSALNVGTATAPTEAEAALAIMGVIGYMMQYKDDQGEAINEEASRWVILCPFNLYGAFQAAVANRLLNTGSGSATNPLPGVWDIVVKMVVGIEATAGTPSAVFYVFRADGRSRAFIRQEETAPALDILGEGSEYMKEHGRALFNVWTSRGAVYGHWFHGSHNTLS